MNPHPWVRRAAVAMSFACGGGGFVMPAAGQTPRIAPPPPCRAVGSGALVALAGRPPAPNAPVVVILPLEARIAEVSQVHLASAVAVGVADRLHAVPGVVVPTAWSTERAWADAGGRIDRLGEMLGARYVMTGTVTSQRTGAAVTVRLFERDPDSPKWEREFAYPETPLRAIQEEVAAALLTTVGLIAGGRSGSDAFTDAATYDDVALGDYYMSQHDTWAPDSARRAYERALARDPRSAPLLARQARAYAASLDRTGRAAPYSAPNALREATNLVNRALAADSTLADAWTARAVLDRVRDPGQYAGALRAHERAVALAPRNADARHEYAVTLVRLGRDQAAETQLRQAVAVDRDRAPSLRLLAELEYMAHRFENACALVNASIGADSYDPLAYALRARVRMRLDEFRDAFSDAETARRLSGGAAWGETLEFYLTAVARDFDASRAESRRLSGIKLRSGVTLGVPEAAYLGMGMSAVGNRDKAFDALSRARPRGAEFRMALRDPGFDRLRKDPRFARMLRGESLVPAERAASGRDVATGAR
jgi:TolB-like protein